jgi:hypothetical protein
MITIDIKVAPSGLLRNSILEIVFLSVRIILIMKDFGLATQDAPNLMTVKLKFTHCLFYGVRAVRKFVRMISL